jgi:hypothetical protein
MSAAAYTLPVDRQGDWIVELERIMDDWDAITDAARDAVCAVLKSVLADTASSASDAIHARAMLARTQRARAAQLRPA